MSWVRWTQICKSKQNGGLGIKDLHVFNLALLSKWRWRILSGNNSALWKRVLEARYGVERPWFGNTMPANVARKTSLWWRDLALLGEGTCLATSWFHEVVKKRMGNGRTIKFWLDTWVGTDPLALLFPSVMAAHNDKDVSMADMGVWVDSAWEWKWNAEVSRDFFAAENVNDPNAVNSFVELLQGVQPNSIDDEDRWVWLLDTPRGFTVKSCYRWLCEKLSSDAPQLEDSVLEACKGLWSNDLPSKILVFCWRLLLKKLPTRDGLLSRGILHASQETSCVFCSNEMETVNHLFCRCSVIKEVWNGVFTWMNVDQVATYDVVQTYKDVGDLSRGSKAKRIKSIFWAATLYQIWMARNRFIFNNVITSASTIVTSIKYVSWGWFISRRGRNSGLMFSDWFSCPMGCIASL